MQDVYLSFPAGGSRRFQKCVCIQEHIIFLQKKVNSWVWETKTVMTWIKLIKNWSSISISALRFARSSACWTSLKAQDLFISMTWKGSIVLEIETRTFNTALDRACSQTTQFILLFIREFILLFFRGQLGNCKKRLKGPERLGFWWLKRPLPGWDFFSESLSSLSNWEEQGQSSY